jgi:hypothetical protein
MRAVEDLESISRNNKEGMKARRIAVGSARDTENLRNRSS